jgi:putative ABC transport system permease protein
MLKNQFKIALRNLSKYKAFTAINLLGLAIGLATCLLITLYVCDELSYDRYNKNADHIYRINADFQLNGSVFNRRTTPAAMAPVLVREYPQIQQAVRIFDEGKMLVKKGTETLAEQDCVYADSNFFQVFTLPLIAGDPNTALIQPESIVISETMAKKYFNSTDIIGKTLLINKETYYKVTGVMADMPAQSHVHYHFIKAMSGLADSRNPNWMTVNFITYILARPGVDRKTIEGCLAQATRKYAEPQLVGFIHSSLDDLEKKGDHFRFVAIPLTDIHLHSTLSDEKEPTGNAEYVYIFIVIAAFILLIACVNFMNLSTARSAGRAREVSVRKVLGAHRGGLISQFLVESVLMAFSAMILAVVLVLLLFPYFKSLTGKQEVLGLFSMAWLLPCLIIATLIVGLLAGSYPAFFLSSFQPRKVLKSNLAIGFRGGWIRNSLVVFQFAIAITLIVGTIVIYRQLDYMRSRKLGYDREQVLILHDTYSLGSHARAFRDALLKMPDVKSVTITEFLPTSVIEETQVYSKDAGNSPGNSAGLDTWSIDADYFPTLGMGMATGRNFSPDQPTDSSAIIINETAARLLGFSDPLRENLYQHRAMKIIGVVRDFNAGSLRTMIKPLVFRLAPRYGAVAIRIDTRDVSNLVSRIEDQYHALDNMEQEPFSYSFMDDDFNRLYHAEQQTGRIFATFASFAIIIACLGLFGLMTYAAEQRTREIGIRKVLGAGVTNIVSMLCSDFLKLVLLATIIAAPLAWWGMHKWLQDFAYRTNIAWWIFAAAGICAILITLTTVSFQAIKAAMANPVKSLRSE